MTLDKHQLDGIGSFPKKVLPSDQFEQLMKDAGYVNAGSAAANGNRIKVWWTHSTHRRVESIYSPDKTIVITAYHPS